MIRTLFGYKLVEFTDVTERNDSGNEEVIPGYDPLTDPDSPHYDPDYDPDADPWNDPDYDPFESDYDPETGERIEDGPEPEFQEFCEELECDEPFEFGPDYCLEVCQVVCYNYDESGTYQFMSGKMTAERVECPRKDQSIDRDSGVS